MIALRPRQRIALALLGYKIWLPRAELAALRQEAQVATAPPEEKLPTAALPASGGGSCILPLAGVAANLHISRDYLWLEGEALRCHWLLPPPWSEGGRLVPFASEDECRLLLALFAAVDCGEGLELFRALFALARSQGLPVPQDSGALPQTAAEKPLIVCGENLQQRLLPPGAAFGKTSLKVYNFLHPYTVLSDMSLKNILWRQWIDIKRSLF